MGVDGTLELKFTGVLVGIGVVAALWMSLGLRDIFEFLFYIK